MKPKLLIQVSLLFFALSCQKMVSPLPENEGPHGGDDSQLVFKTAKNNLSRLKSIKACSFRSQTPETVKTWVLENLNSLVEDIQNSEHQWRQDAGVPCARTDHKRNAPLFLSYSSCEKMNAIDAERILIHEAVHHFGIATEEFPTEVAMELSSASERNCIPDEAQIHWLDRNVGHWPATAQLRKVEIQHEKLCFDFSSAKEWPQIDPFNAWKTIGNYWVIAYIRGEWLAATYEWILPGQMCEDDNAFSISLGTKRDEFLSPKWVPQAGELVGFMVSSVARFENSNGVEERSPVHWIRWP